MIKKDNRRIVITLNENTLRKLERLVKYSKTINHRYYSKSKVIEGILLDVYYAVFGKDKEDGTR